MSAASISQAIRDANPSITNRSLAVTCSGPELAEVRVCLDKDLKPMACGAGVRNACRSGAVRIPGAH
jgi:ribonuclease T2